MTLKSRISQLEKQRKEREGFSIVIFKSEKEHENYIEEQKKNGGSESEQGGFSLHIHTYLKSDWKN